MDYDRSKIVQEVDPKDIVFLQGNSFSNLNTVISIPTRGMIHIRVVLAWKALMMPLNSHIQTIAIEKMEVGEARNKSAQHVLDNKGIEYLLFLDDDVIPPEDTLLRLMRVLIDEGYDMVSGTYHQKNPFRAPLGYRYIDGILTNITREEELSGKVFDVDVIGMGCTLIKRKVFETIPFPLFKTNEVKDGNRTKMETEDVYFCKLVKKHGFRIGIHTGIQAGHMDTESGVIY